MVWTEAELKQLIDMRNSGYSIQAIAQALGRTEESISSKLKKYRKSGIVKKYDAKDIRKSKRTWTDEEIQQLINLKNEGLTYKKIAQKLNKTRDSVHSMYKQLKKKGFNKTIFQKFWTEEEIQTLINLRNEGKQIKEIAKILNKTPEAVKSKIKYIRTYSNKISVKSNYSFINEAPKIKQKISKTTNAILAMRFNKDSENEIISLYRKLILDLTGKSKNTENLLIAIENYYLVTKNYIGAKKLLESFKKSGKF